MLRRRLAISGAVTALVIGLPLLPHATKAAPVPLSVALSPTPPILVGGKATATATVVPTTPPRTIRFDITSGTAHVTTAVTKLALPVLTLGLSVIVVTDSTGFIGGEPINIDGVGTHEQVTLAAGPVTSTTLTLTTPMAFTHAAGAVVTTASALTDPSTGQATANVTAGLGPGHERLTVTDVTDFPSVQPVDTFFDQVTPPPPPPPPTQTQRFVNAVYQDLLNRLPDAVELPFWSGSIDAAGGSVAARTAFVSAVVVLTSAIALTSPTTRATSVAFFAEASTPGSAA